MIEINWADVYHQTPTFDGDQMRLGTLRVPLDEFIDFGAPVGRASARSIAYATNTQSSILGWSFNPQLAMMVFLATRRPYALNSYFPLTQTLDKEGQRSFYRLAAEITRQPKFEVCLFSWIEKRMAGVLRIENDWRGMKERGR